MNRLYSAIHSMKNMDTKFKIVLLLAVTSVNAGLIAVSPNVLEGPSSRTILIGPDGSQISAVIPGGKIILDGSQAPVLQGAPEVVAIPSVAQPLPAVVALPITTDAKADIPVSAVEIPVVGTGEVKTGTEAVVVDSINVAAKSVPEKVEDVAETGTEAVTETEAPIVTASSEIPKTEAEIGRDETLQVVQTTSVNSTEASPPLEISTSVGDASNVSESASVKAVESPVVLSRSSPLLAPDFEGEYVADNLEKLFDDGSYKPGDFQW